MANTTLERIPSSIDGPQNKMRQVWETARDRWAALQTKQRTMIIAILCAVLALGSAITWWGSRTEWSVLFNGLEARDAQQVEQQLGAAGVPYRTAANGSVLEVPSDQVEKARMAIAAKGMPASGRMGFEIFDKPNWVGSEFDEKVNYQRALEGELEHTIETISAVRSARVHLVLPKEALFAAEERPATASVVLKLRNSSLPHEQVNSIRNLVAGAVENLHPEQVTLIDADGRMNFDRPSAEGIARDEESALEQKLIAVLEPLAGVGNVRATVNIRYDQGTEDRTDEMYDPQGAVPVNVQRSEQSSSHPVKGGVPVGTASNSPAAQATGTTGAPPLLQAEKKETTAQTQTVREESSNYAVTRHVVHTQEGPGRIQHVSAAIVVNDRLIPATGKLPSIWKARSADEIHRFEELAQAAVGFDPRRGDSVVVQNIGFSSNTAEAAPSFMARVGDQTHELLRSQPGLLRTAGLIAAVVLLYFFIARPALKQVALALEPPKAMEPMALEAPPQEEPLVEAIGEMLTPKRVLEKVHDHMRTEPQHGKRILEAWIGSQDVEGV